MYLHKVNKIVYQFTSSFLVIFLLNALWKMFEVLKKPDLKDKGCLKIMAGTSDETRISVSETLSKHIK